MPGRRASTIAALAMLCLTGLCLPGLARAGAWPQAPGHGQLILTAATAGAADVFGSEAGSAATDFSKQELRGWFEYGLGHGLTLTYAPVWSRVTSDGALLREGAGRSELALRYSYERDDGQVLALQAGYIDTGEPSRSALPEIGAQGREAELRAMWGRGFTLAGHHAYADLQAARRWRGGAPPDEWRADLTLGLDLHERLSVQLQSFNTLSAGAGAAGYPAYRYHKVQIGTVAPLAAGWSVQTGLTATLAGDNALKERGALLSLWKKF